MNAQHILKQISDGPRYLVDFTAPEWELIGTLVNNGWVTLQYGARRANDLVCITDAGRAALTEGSADEPAS